MGELSAADERRFVALRTAKERQLLAAADVICCTCISAADSRLSHMRIKLFYFLFFHSSLIF